MTYEEFCTRFQIQLNEQQTEAVRSVEGPVLLLAVPGSGKTTVLITRLGYMIYCVGIAPRQILTLTYTVAATHDMAARFCSYFGEELGGRLEGAKIREIDLKSRSAQYRYLLKVADGCRTQTAVLYRDNESVLPLVDLLDRQEIPYRIRNAELTFFTHRVVLDIQNIILFAENPRDTELFMQIYYKISTYISKQSAVQICEISREKGIDILEAAIFYGALEQKKRESCLKMRSGLRKLLTDSAEQAVNRIVRDLGYGEYLKRAELGEGKLFILRFSSLFLMQYVFPL